MQLTMTIFSDSLIFIEKKRVENRLWAKSDFLCAKKKIMTNCLRALRRTVSVPDERVARQAKKKGNSAALVDPSPPTPNQCLSLSLPFIPPHTVRAHCVCFCDYFQIRTVARGGPLPRVLSSVHVLPRRSHLPISQAEVFIRSTTPPGPRVVASRQVEYLQRSADSMHLIQTLAIELKRIISQLLRSTM